MWPFTKLASTSLAELLFRPMRCGTPLLWAQRNNPNFRIRSIYEQSDGSKIVEDVYPYDGRRVAHLVPKGGKVN